MEEVDVIRASREKVSMTTQTALVASAAVGGTYVRWGVISISITNLAIIGAMIVLFVVALLLPFPHGKADRLPERDRSEEEPR
jgi:hypothetical protein